MPQTRGNKPNLSTQDHESCGLFVHQSMHEKRVELVANLRTTMKDFKRFYSIIILMLRGGILMPIGPQYIFGQQILVGPILVGRLGVPLHIAPMMHSVGHPSTCATCAMCRARTGLSVSSWVCPGGGQFQHPQPGAIGLKTTGLNGC
jgi:hypothetical protein